MYCSYLVLGFSEHFVEAKFLLRPALREVADWRVGSDFRLAKREEVQEASVDIDGLLHRFPVGAIVHWAVPSAERGDKSKQRALVTERLED